jgi:CRISPR-associated protein Csd1
LDWFDKPDAGRVANLIESVANAKNKVATNLKSNQFYSLTLSGAAARIAVRDWIEISLEEYKRNIAQWFEDVRINYYDSDSKQLLLFYPSLNQLSWNCGSLVQSKRDKADEQIFSRVATHYGTGHKKTVPAILDINICIKKNWPDEVNSEGKSINTFTTARASLIKLILNRNINGGTKMKEELDFENTSPSYLCGRLFALIEGYSVRHWAKI